MSTKFYAGIGSRSISKETTAAMCILANELNLMGYTLRSGNAKGSDQAFASGVQDEKAQIWLPWEKFELEFQEAHPQHDYKLMTKLDVEAYDSVERFHPYYKQMEKGNATAFYNFMTFMTRNYRQVRGFNEPDSEFVICWTHDGTDVGGTGQAIRIATHYNIPVFNLYYMSISEVLKEIDKWNMIN